MKFLLQNPSGFNSPKLQFNSPRPKNMKMMILSLKKNLFLLPKLSSLASATPSPAENLNSVTHFFKHHGFTDSNISSIVSKRPRILSLDIEKSLRPNLFALRAMGFADDELHKLITANPCVLSSPAAIPRLEFWRTFLNGDNKLLLLALTRNCGLILHDIDKNVTPKIAFLKDLGLSEDDIRLIVVRYSGIFIRSLSSIDALMKRAQELGFRRDSTMFLNGLWTLSKLGSKLFVARMELFKSFGWSEEEFLTAFRKFPHFANLAEENIREKMEFLVGRAGIVQSYIASRPMILNYSLERRLMPRYHVMNILKLNESIGREWDFYSMVSISEKNFVNRVILRYKVEIPALYGTYVAACSGEVPIEFVMRDHLTAEA